MPVVAGSTTFGERVRQLMVERDIPSVRQLAKAVPCNSGYLSRIMSGQRSPSEQMAARLDYLLGANGELVAIAAETSRPRRDGREGLPQGEVFKAGRFDTDGDLISVVVEATRRHVELVEATEVGPGTLEQLRADVVDLSRAYVFTPPLSLLSQMNRVRERIFDALERKSHPRQANELYLLAGALCALMANACLDLGRCKAGDELARSAWTYGTIIGHGALMGWARGTQALAALLDGRPCDALRLVEDGLEYQRIGMGGARLYSMSARALASTADAPRAREAQLQAEDAREHAKAGDLYDELGGEFAFAEAKQHYYAAVTRVGLGDAHEAETAATTAIRLYEAAPRRDRSYGCEALARSQLALARLMSGELEGAEEALEPIFRLPPSQRINSLTGYLDAGRDLLRQPTFHGSPKATELSERLALFCINGVTRTLTSDWNDRSI